MTKVILKVIYHKYWKCHQFWKSVSFPAISMEKSCKNYIETLYSSKGKIVYVVGKLCNIYRLRGNPIVCKFLWYLGYITSAILRLLPYLDRNRKKAGHSLWESFQTARVFLLEKWQHSEPFFVSWRPNCLTHIWFVKGNCLFSKRNGCLLWIINVCWLPRVRPRQFFF